MAPPIPLHHNGASGFSRANVARPVAEKKRVSARGGHNLAPPSLLLPGGEQRAPASSATGNPGLVYSSSLPTMPGVNKQAHPCEQQFLAAM